MEIERLLLDVMGPVVLVVGLGALAGPRLQLDRRHLSRLAYWLLGPAFVYDLFANTSLPIATVWRLAIAGWAGMGAAILGVIAIGRMTKVRGRSLRAATMTGSYGNVGNAGLAISAFALGNRSLAAAAVLMLVINITGITLGVGLASRSSSLPRSLLRGLLSPMPVAAMAALIINQLNLSPPLALTRSTELLAGAMIPVMLLTLGLQLAHSGRPPLGRATLLSTGAKLALSPIAAIMTAQALGLGGDELAVVAIQSAMPPAVFCVLVGLEYDLEPDQVTGSVVWATLASVFTLPIVLLMAT